MARHHRSRKPSPDDTGEERELTPAERYARFDRVKRQRRSIAAKFADTLPFELDRFQTDANEALVKKTAMEQCGKAYILADHSKFHVVSSVTFAHLKAGIILTDQSPEEYREATEIVQCP